MTLSHHFRSLCLCVVALAAFNNPVFADHPAWESVPKILERIVAPVFPERDFDILTFGAVGGGDTDCRKAIVDAIAACVAAGGGRVVVPPGRYACNGPIHLLSGVNLHLAEGATIAFGANPDDYLTGDPAKGGCVPVTWEGVRCYNYSPMIYASGQTNIAITGKGTLDGQIRKGWDAWLKLQGPAQKQLRTMGQNQTPLAERVFGKGSFLRPSLIEPTDCKNVLIEGITATASPFWTIHPVRCENVTVRGVTVTGETWNDDGCDPESCSDVLIEDCTFSTRDDNIAIKAGRDNDGWAKNGGRPCENIVIRNCRFVVGSPGGVAIGSEMSGDVRNVFVENCRMAKVQRPLFIKSNPDRGGTVENIHMRNVSVEECQWLFQCEMTYKRVLQGPNPPNFRNISIERVACGSAGRVVDLAGLPGHPVQDVLIKDITVKTAGKIPASASETENVRLENVTVGGIPLTFPAAPQPPPEAPPSQ